MGDKQIEKLTQRDRRLPPQRRPLPHRRGRRCRHAPLHLPAGLRRNRARHARRLAAPRPRDRRRSRPARHRPCLRAGVHCEPPSSTSPPIPAFTASSPRAKTRSASISRNGMQVDVRLLPSASYGAALQYFTGSKAHNVSLRQRALKMGYTLSEWALARLDDDSTVAAATEEEIYSALGMDWMPPELRENLGEIEAAAQSHAAPPHSKLPTSAATCTCTPPPPTATTPFARWPKPPSPAATSTSPSPTTPRTWP